MTAGTLREFARSLCLAGCLLTVSAGAAWADPIDLSPEAISAREAIYDIPGVARLTGVNTPLQPGERIVFYGDSITWLGDYVDHLAAALAASPHTASLGVVLVNRGIDCAETLDILSGVQGFCGGQNAPDFATRLAADTPTIAVIFAGINEVRHGLGPVFAASEQALRDLVALAQSGGARVVLASPAVSGEHPDGSNPFDPDIDTFAAIGAAVAADAGATFVDPRAVFIAYLGNHNVTVLPDESQVYASSGVLTIDEVHPTPIGIELIAEHLADGIVRAYAPSVPILAGAASIALAASMAALGIGRVRRAARRPCAHAHAGSALRAPRPARR